jgi:5-methylcytosine-specific restriction protein A
MTFGPGLQFGAEIDNARLCDIFKCSPQGGMRRSKQTNTLVIVSNHVESIYEDRWDASEVLHYTGMGRLGDQSLTRAQNKTLAETRSNGVDVFLFEVHKPRIYAFGGQVELTGEPYPETQPDEHGTQRRVWMFPLRLVGPSGPLVISAEDHRASQQRKAKHAQGLSDEELLLRAQHAPAQPGRQRIETTQFTRDPHVAELAKRNANGCCQLCGAAAPFQDKSGAPYLETHHIVWLARGGSDSIKNTVALCPNCHRRMHVLDLVHDFTTLNAVVRRLR